MCFSCPTTDMQQDVKAELFLTLPWQRTQDNICQLFHALELDHLVGYEKKNYRAQRNNPQFYFPFAGNNLQHFNWGQKAILIVKEV